MDKEAPAGGMDIGWAVKAAKNGHEVRRTGWARKSMYLYYQEALPQLGLDWPFLVKRWHDGTVPWMPTHDDLLAIDWELAEGPDDTDMTEADIDRAMEGGTPVQVVPSEETETARKGWGGIR